jgi:sugar/nucleoside kinase (ribokinase family)
MRAASTIRNEAPMLELERERVATAARRLAAEELVVGTAGNISMRAGELVAITPTGAVLADVEPQQVERVPAFAIEVVDTTGRGDAFPAGFLRGLSLGRSERDAAVLGCAAAALVAQGLGSHHGDFDLDEADEFGAAMPAMSA